MSTDYDILRYDWNEKKIYKAVVLMSGQTDSMERKINNRRNPPGCFCLSYFKSGPLDRTISRWIDETM